ncbi:hypothetical protein Tco_0432180 [Tanacetum coccineum]
MGRDTIQLEDVVSTISQEYLLEFSLEYFIPENLHLELPGPGDHIVDFPEGKIGIYTKKIEFANFRIPISQFLFDILGYYQIHLSQLSVIGAAKVSHFEINCRVLNIIPTVNLFRVFYVPSYNSGWMSFSKRPGKNTPQCYTKPLDSLKNWNNRFFWVDEKVFPTVVAWRTAATKDDKPHANTYSVVDVATLDTHHTPFQKQPEELLCLVGLSRNFFLHDDEYPIFLNDNDQATASRVMQTVDATELSTSSGTPSTVERSPLDFSNEDAPPPLTQGVDAGVHGPAVAEQEIPVTDDAGATEATMESNLEKEVISMGPTIRKRCRQRDAGEEGSKAPAKVLRKDHDAACAEHSARRGKIAGEDESSKEKGVAGYQDSERSTPSPPITGSPESIYQPGWGVPNSCRLDTLKACQDVVDHIAPPGYFSELRHLRNDEFLRQYNINLARQVAMGSQLRLEAKLLKKSVAQVAHRDQRIATREKHIKELEAQLEAEINMKKAAEVKNSEVTKELEDIRMRFSGLEVGNAQLSQYVSVLQAQVIGHGLRLAVMKCAESMELRQAFANVVSAGIAKGMSEGLKYGVEHGKAGLELTAVEAYDLEADNKYVAALYNLKYLNYPLIDELEQLKDAPLDDIMASLYLDSDTGEDAPQSICDLRPSSSQLKILVYPEVHNPRNPWACKDEILLEDAIAENISRTEKKKKSRVVCRIHGVGSHHARSDGILVSVPTVAPQGLQILLADAATQTEDEESPRLLRSKSLPALFTLDLP